MRIEQAQAQVQAEAGPKNLLVAVVMDMALVVAVLLSVLSVPPKHEIAQSRAAQPEVAAIASR